MKGISALPGDLTLFEFHAVEGPPLSGSVFPSMRSIVAARRIAHTRDTDVFANRVCASVMGPRLCSSNRAWMAHGVVAMVASQAETLRKAIENLVDAKLHDALSRPGGLERLTAHRLTGVASFDIRNAERKLQQTLAEILSDEPVTA